jgi:predicted aldo/keto reductase-like oxidoreductase
LHNPKELPDPNDPESTYAGVLEAKRQGKIRFLGVSNHVLTTAIQAAESELYDTIQFPLSSLVSEADLAFVSLCKEKDLGVIAMKALSGGLITRVATTFTFLRQYDHVVPIWGIQRLSELEEFLALEKNPPPLDEAMWDIIRKDRAELAGDFCRACGYCLPCPVGIDIPMQARISLALGRLPIASYLTDSYRAKMDLIRQCQECGHCRDHCPYKLDTPNLLKRELKKYDDFYQHYQG